MPTHARLTIATLLLILAALPAGAQPVVLEADGYLDVAAGAIVRPAVIVVDGDRIVAVNPDHTPAGATQVDLSGLILSPGLIDVHTHLSYEISGDWTNRFARETETDSALRGVRNARKTLLAGFTTIRELGAFMGGADVALMHAIERGDIIGPRIYPARQSISITGGHCDITGFAPGVLEEGPEGGTADGIAEVLKAVRYQIKHGAKVVKICATAGVLSFEGPVGAPQYSIEELRAAVEEAHRHGVRIAAHAHGTEGIKMAIRAGIDSVEHGSLLDEEAIQLFLEHDTYLVMNIYPPGVVDVTKFPPPLRAKAEYVFPRREESFTRAAAAGVKMAYGTDAGVYEHGLNAQQLAVRVRLGMSPADAIRTATVNAADLIGSDEFGSISAGLYADLIAVAGNPLDDVTLFEDVRFVMKEGEVYKRP
jgi:imidazolonepropionase-like amidohydrolase